ncbi:hypothetical protein ONS96_006831 [Cadophora gregata f. sp. sojae]|nr:hypothetical protein ONS96_006831 [Cadophora gregata f. sp. sojae]
MRVGSDSNNDFDDDQANHPGRDEAGHHDADHSDSDYRDVRHHYQDDDGQNDELNEDYQNDFDLGENSHDSSESPEPPIDTAGLEEIDLTNLEEKLTIYAEKLEKLIPVPGEKRWTKPNTTYGPKIYWAMKKGLTALSSSGGDIERESAIANKVREGITRARNKWMNLEPGLLKGSDGFNLFLRSLAMDLKMPKPP